MPLTFCSAMNDEDRIFTTIQVCNSYRQFENRFQCGPNGYFLGYGERYCKRFFDKGIFNDVPSKMPNYSLTYFFIIAFLH